MNEELVDKGWQELQARIEQLHAKYFGEEMHRIEFKFLDIREPLEMPSESDGKNNT